MKSWPLLTRYRLKKLTSGYPHIQALIARVFDVSGS